MKKLLIIIFVFFIISACDEPISKITIVNHTGYDIYCYPSTLYPDTSIAQISISRLTALSTYSVLAHQTKELGGAAYCDQNIWDGYVKKDTLIIFVFEKQIIDSKPFDTIIKYDLLHSKYLYTFEELQAKLCQITVE